MQEGDILELKRTLRVEIELTFLGKWRGRRKSDGVLCVEKIRIVAPALRSNTGNAQNIDEKKDGG